MGGGEAVGAKAGVRVGREAPVPVSGKASPCPSLALAVTPSGRPALGATRDVLQLQMCILAAGQPWAGSLPSLVLCHFPVIRCNNACITGPPRSLLLPARGRAQRAAGELCECLEVSCRLATS